MVQFGGCWGLSLQEQGGAEPPCDIFPTEWPKLPSLCHVAGPRQHSALSIQSGPSCCLRCVHEAQPLETVRQKVHTSVNTQEQAVCFLCTVFTYWQKGRGRSQCLQLMFWDVLVYQLPAAELSPDFQQCPGEFQRVRSRREGHLPVCLCELCLSAQPIMG